MVAAFMQALPLSCLLVSSGRAILAAEVPPSTTPPALYRVHLLDEATVVERGERVRVWFVPEGETWVRAADHTEAELDTASSERGGDSCPPGTIWQRSVELLLPAGTPVLSRTTTPKLEVLEPMEYLRRGKLGAGRHVQESWLCVLGNYRLGRLEQAPASWLHQLEKSRNEAR